LALLTLALPTAVAAVQWSSLQPAAASCNTTSSLTYWHGDTYSNYSTGVDGMQALTSWTNSRNPYVCNPDAEHSLESIGLFLPSGPDDYLEIGEDMGLIESNAGGWDNSNGVYFFNYTSTIDKNGSDWLSVPQNSPMVGWTHTNSAWESVSCNPTCHLYANYKTDSTTWAQVGLPSGDNPGKQVVTNGEVANDSADNMGEATFQNLKVHAGSWNYWSNKTVDAAASPYCNVDISGSQPSTWETNNWGPQSGSC
jgi:hypothetical protein